MGKEMKKVVLADENGDEYELEVVKEFDYKDKKYIVLYEDGCKCEDDCECHEECECDDECEDDCDCECHSECDEYIYIMEVVKTEDGNEEYREVAEDLMKEIVPIVEKELYPTE